MDIRGSAVLVFLNNVHAFQVNLRRSNSRVPAVQGGVGHVQPYFVGSAAIGCCYNTGFHTFMFSLTVLLLAVPYHSGADAASLPSGGNGAE